MKKYLIASVVAVAVALVASSANAALTRNLTVGSSGADVAELQTFLIARGHAIPAISSGVAAPGYFGSQTKAAVMAYQAANGVPNTGFFGPLTRASVGAMMGGGVAGGGTAGTLTVPFPCPAGFTPPAPWVCPGTAPVNPGTPSTYVADGRDGSLTLSLSSYASNVTIKKGETKDMVAVKAQATAGQVAVQRFDVRFNKRPWLYFGTITLKDSTGVVIATKQLTSSADATEITVGSDYLVRFEGLSAVVNPGTDRIFVVSGSVLTTTDKLTSDVTTIVSVPNDAIRTINGKGYTDSLGLGTVATAGTSGRTITLSSTGSIGNILGRLSAVSPANRIVTTSTSGETTGVVLGKFDFKSENAASTINTLTFTLKDNAGNKPFSTIFKRVYISDGSTTVQVDSVASSSVFSNLTFALPLDQWKTFTVTADVADQDDFTAGAMASSTITINTTNIVGIDSNFTAATASGGNEVPSNNVTFLPAGASVTNAPNGIVTNVDNGTSAPVKKTVNFTFTFNNIGSTDLYLSTNGYLAVATSSTIATSSQVIAATTTTFSVFNAGDAQNGDTASVYAVRAGTSRGFTLAGLIDRTRSQEATAQSGVLYITKVYFGDDTTNIRESYVDFGLDNLKTPFIAF